MISHTLSQVELAALVAQIHARTGKAKTSITISDGLLKVIDNLAGTSQRTAWIERAVRAYALRELKAARHALEVELPNRHAAALNAEEDDSADSANYEADWDAE
jgi:hypothetical protein